MPMTGKPDITTHTDYLAPADKFIKGVQNTLWDAWQIGLQKSGDTMYPRLPLLDQEPMEPEI